MLEVSDGAIDTLSLDHHGVVAGICKELRIAERINEQLKVHDKQIVSTGQALVSMIINGLSFANYDQIN